MANTGVGTHGIRGHLNVILNHHDNILAALLNRTTWDEKTAMSSSLSNAPPDSMANVRVRDPIYNLRTYKSFLFCS